MARNPDPRIVTDQLKRMAQRFAPDLSAVADDAHARDLRLIAAEARKWRQPARPTRGPRTGPPPGHVVAALAEMVAEAKLAGAKLHRDDAMAACAMRLGAWPTQRDFFSTWQAQVPKSMQIGGGRKRRPR